MNLTRSKKRIYKYVLQPTDEQTLLLPVDPGILSVGIDPNGAVCLWAIVDLDAASWNYEVYVHGTGHNCFQAVESPAVRFLGTVKDNSFIWHIFFNTEGSPA